MTSNIHKLYIFWKLLAFQTICRLKQGDRTSVGEVLDDWNLETPLKTGCRSPPKKSNLDKNTKKSIKHPQTIHFRKGLGKASVTKLILCKSVGGRRRKDGFTKRPLVAISRFSGFGLKKPSLGRPRYRPPPQTIYCRKGRSMTHTTVPLVFRNSKEKWRKTSIGQMGAAILGK